MPRIPQKRVSGLFAQPNSLVVPDGGVEKLVNIIHQQDNIYVKERGFQTIYTPAGTIYGVFEYGDYIVVIFNSTVIRIDKFGAAQGTATASDTPFEIDGTLRPANNSIAYAPFSLLTSGFAYFTTPDGVRVMRSDSSNESMEPGIEAPVLAGSLLATNAQFISLTWTSVGSTITISYPSHLKTLASTFTILIGDAFSAGGTVSETNLNAISNGVTGTAATANTITYTAPGGAPTNTSGTLAMSFLNYPFGGTTQFGINDFLLIPANKTSSGSGQYQVGDVPADKAVSFRGVMRRTFSNGSVIESRPSAPIFAFNTMVSRTWTHAAGTVTITITGHCLPVGNIYSGKVSQAFAGSTNETGAEGTTLTFTVATANTITYTAPGTVSGASGTCLHQFDRYSLVNAYLSAGREAGDSLDIYFSESELTLSDNPLAVPDSEYFLAREIPITISTGALVNFNLSNGIFQKGVPLYTNPATGSGNREPNELPPGANCIEIWKGCMFYANTFRRESVTLTHIGGELTTTQTISLQFTDSGTPENFTMAAVRTLADGVIIKKRIQTLAASITFGSANFIAYYSDDTLDFPGGIVIYSRVPNRRFKVFAGASAGATSFEPNLGTTFANTEVISDNESKRNRIYWSKPDQPEAVPFFTSIGNQDEDILNIKQVRESLIVVKTDGIYALFGDPTTGILNIRAIDLTVWGISATGVTTLGNRCYAKTNQGIVAISESSLSIVSRNQVEPLLKISDENRTLDTIMYAAEEDRQLYICTRKSPADSTKTVYSYNYITQTWSELTRTFDWACVIKNNVTNTKTFANNRVITNGTSVLMERKDNLLTDWSSDSVTRTVSAVSGAVVTLNSAYTGSVNSALAWVNSLSETKLYRIIEISGNDVTLNVPFSGVATDSVTIYEPIESVIRTAPIDGGDSSIVKQFTTFVMNLRYDSLSACTLKFSSDWFEHGEDTEWEQIDSRRGWGQQQWGRFPWGQATGRTLEYFTKPSQIIQTEVPRLQQSTTFLQTEIVHNVACEGMFIQQMAFNVRTSSERPAR